jgi:hypothetical protein
MHSKPTNEKKEKKISCRVHVDFNTSRTQKKEGLGTGTTPDDPQDHPR